MTENTSSRVLALKYRPQQFSALVGQEYLVKTLSNAIQYNRLHHSYLLSGTRGIGKTTTARIIAKALNCLNPSGIEPCGICNECIDITKGNHPDIFEFDAASNTGIDDVKKLLEGIIYEPIRAKKKIYIIDEVHMLSEKAFNSLLKTLEEPPANIIFIFATTERNQVPVTILSRCQKFFLKNLSPDEMFLHLVNICKMEDIEFEEEALRIISTKADGSVRDALSILDQVIISSTVNAGGKVFIQKSVVIAAINIFDKEDAVDLLKTITSNNVALCIEKINQILASGFNELDVLIQMMEVINDCIKIKNDINVGDSWGDLKDIALQNSVPSLLRLWQICLKSLRDFNLAGSAKTKLEMIVVKMCYSSTLPTPAEAIERLNNLPLNEILSIDNIKLVDKIK